MIYKEYPIRIEGMKEEATLITYLISHSESVGVDKRPLIIICPGGGYEHVSDREGEMLALQWASFGYHAAVLRYSISPAVYPTALLQLAAAVRFMREHADEWHIMADKILIEGSSAGGHLAANYSMFWNRGFLAQKLGVPSELLRPAGMILNYPVITSGEYAHEGSFRRLLEENYEAMKAELSLENQVNEDTPPAFIWHTNEDTAVPAENSLLLALAMRERNIPVELHLYAKGGHGLGLADERTVGPERKEIEPECQSWIALAHTWIEEVILASQ
ncbi:MAG: alpha/beta hydrolase [Bacillus sp. (in: Bacteria)]|nr:alpha/beta hydrolase [Bacillus sp. (in: firmicutes)]MCM1426191.1 alpha/beta hydrolase [Eubacterium sp.]